MPEQLKTARQPNLTCRVALVVVTALLLQACTPLSGIAAVGQVVNAAGTAAMEGATEQRRNRPASAIIEEAAEGALRDLANSGDPGAEYRLGVLLLGRQDARALDLICRAANQRYPKAQLMLGHWFDESRSDFDPWPFISVRPDNGRAYMWYRLAEQGGELKARYFREDLVSSGLAPEAIISGETMVKNWQSGGCY